LEQTKHNTNQEGVGEPQVDFFWCGHVDERVLLHGHRQTKIQKVAKNRGDEMFRFFVFTVLIVTCLGLFSEEMSDGKNHWQKGDSG
jgi:hypothetical protein